MKLEAKTCTRCVMNTTDPNINFDEKGSVTIAEILMQR